MPIKIVYDQQGEPAKVLRAEESQTSEPGPDQVVIQIESSTITPADLATIRGVYRTPQKVPATPGYEGVGRLLKIGTNVKSVKVGQRVLISFSTKSGWQNGSWQEYACKDEHQVYPIPDTGDANVWVQFFNTILTPWIMAVDKLDLKSGDTLLVTGCGSTVGQILIQISKIRGFSIIGVVRRPEQVEFIKSLGVQNVLCSATDDITQKCLALTQLKGVTAVLDAVGGKVASQCFRALKDRGSMIVYGLLDLEREASIDIRKMLFYNLSLEGFWLPDWWMRTPLDHRTRLTNTVIDLVATDKLIAPVETCYAFKDIVAAVTHAEKPGNKGRIILKPS